MGCGASAVAQDQPHQQPAANKHNKPDQPAAANAAATPPPPAAGAASSHTPTTAPPSDQPPVVTQAWMAAADPPDGTRQPAKEVISPSNVRGVVVVGGGPTGPGGRSRAPRLDHRNSVSAILTAHSGKKQNLLIMETDAAVSALLQASLYQNNYRATTCQTSDAAFHALQTKNLYQPPMGSEDDEDDDDDADGEAAGAGVKNDPIHRGGWSSEESFDAIIVSLTPSAGGTNEGTKLLLALKQHSTYKNIPVLTMLDPSHPACGKTGLQLLNNSIALGSSEFLILNPIAGAAVTLASSSTPNPSHAPVPESVLLLKLHNLFALQALQVQRGTLISRGNKYKTDLAAAEQMVRNHATQLKMKEKAIATLTKQIESSQTRNGGGGPNGADADHIEAAKRAEKVAELNETPLLQLAKRFDAVLKDPAFTSAAISPEVIEELTALRTLLATSRSLYTPDFDELARKSEQEGGGGAGAGGVTASWLRARFSIYEPRSPLTGDIHARSASFISMPVHQPSHLNKDCLAAFERWDWNIWDWTIDDLLPCLTLLCHNFDLLSLLKLNEQKLTSFFYTMPQHYQLVPYHSIYHGINVLQMLYVLCRNMDGQAYLSPKDLLAVLIGGLGHDVDHGGFNNAYMIDTHSELALVYNDQSVMEHHHCSLTFRLLRRPENNIFEGMKPTDAKEIRTTIIQSILATDMSRHFELHTQVKTKLSNRPDPLAPAFDRKNEKDRLLICQLLIKCADIGNVAAPWEAAVEWGNRANLEFTHQGDIERAAGRTPAPFLDRFKITGEQNTLAFTDYVARPLVESMVALLPQSKPYLDQIDVNRAKLGEICKQQKAEEAAKAAAAAAAASPPTPAADGPPADGTPATPSLTVVPPVSPPSLTPGPSAFPSEVMRQNDLRRFTPRTTPSILIPAGAGQAKALYRAPLKQKQKAGKDGLIAEEEEEHDEEEDGGEADGEGDEEEAPNQVKVEVK
jgi:hypothetical protein